MQASSKAVRQSDRRSLLLLILAIVPIVTVVWFSVGQWRSMSTERAAVDADLSPATSAHLGYSFLDRATRSILVREAAAMPGASSEIVYLATSDADTAPAEFEERFLLFSADVEALALSVGESPERTLALTEFAYNLLDSTLAAHTIGTPVPESTDRVLADSRNRLIEVALPRLTSRVHWLADHETRLYSLMKLDADHDRDLQAAMRGPVEPGSMWLADLRRIRWNPPTQRWELDGLVPTSVVVSAGDFTGGSLLLTDNPLTDNIIELGDHEGDVDGDREAQVGARRSQLVARALDADLELRAAIDSAYLDVLNAAQAERNRLSRDQRLVLAVGGLMSLFGVALFMLVLNEVRERRRVRTAHDAALTKMANLAHRDSLTGLYNRRWLELELPERLSSDGSVVLAYLDVDRFKGVNDVWGHPVGDGVLRTVASRLTSAMTDDGFEVARFGGDEFIVMGVVDSSTDRADIETIGDRLLAAFDDPVAIDGRTLDIHGSVGLTWSTGDSTVRSMLLEADLALLAAKRNGRGRAMIYDRSISDVLELVGALPQAFARNEFEMELQPVVNPVTRTVHHYEALARWRRPDGTTIGPDTFIPLIESLALTSELTAAMVRSVADYARDHADPLPVFVNVSPIEFEVPGLGERLVTMITGLGMATSAIGIEVTERAAIGDLVGFEAELRRLRDVGISVAIDDFGAGYSPLGYLRDLPIDVLKIDRSLIAGVDRDPGARIMLRGIIGFAHNLGLGLVAEGVERDEELELLVAEGVDLVQGWLTGRPMAPDVVADADLGTDSGSLATR